MNTEITFNDGGLSTIIGNYSAYLELDKAINAKSVYRPVGRMLKCDLITLKTLVEHVQLFGHCIKTLKGFRKVCELAGAELI